MYSHPFFLSAGPAAPLNGGAARCLGMGQSVGMETAHESDPIRRAGGAESPTFNLYSATGAEKMKWAPNCMGNGVSLMILWGRLSEFRDGDTRIHENSYGFLNNP
jgi:hypothetical protein